MLRKDIEYIVHCEKDGSIIWPISKVHAHFPWARKSLTHFSTWSMVYNPSIQKYGLQLKNSKKHDSSTWWKRDMWVAWHNCYVQKWGLRTYMDFSENLKKEAEEEIWIQLVMHENIDRFKESIPSFLGSIWYIFTEFLFENEINNEYVWLWLILTDRNKFDYIDWEVVDFKWLSSSELEDFLVNESEKCCSALPIAFEKAKIFLEEVWIT